MIEADWRRRFRAPRTTLPEWAADAPERLLYASNHVGRWELFTWDRTAGVHRQLTDRREGTLNGHIEPRGERVWWFDDTDGDELGRWMVDAFDGSARHEALPALGRAYGTGLELGRSVAVVGGSTSAGSTIDVVADGRAHRIYANAQESWLGGLSSNERLLCFHHAEHGDSRHAALRVVDLDGATVADLWDGPELGLESAGFSWAADDERVLVSHERGGFPRPMLWWPRDGRTRTFELDLPGEIEASWYPDGRALLLVHEHAGRSSLYRLELDPERLVELPMAPGTVSAAAARPDGDVWYLWSDAQTPPEIRSVAADGRPAEVVLRAPGEASPGGVHYRDLQAGSVPAFVAEPATPRPHPTIFAIHGGPEAHDRDSFSPLVQAWVDHGFAVVMVNYRGSTGYGREWRDALTGNPGLTELADIAAVYDRVLAEGIAQPGRVVLSGNSWGGYLTLLGLSLQADRWALGVAGVPVADYIAAYEDEMDPLKAYDRALFGASPEEDPALYNERSPLTFIEAVSVPIMILAGANDPRCPIRQIDNYLERLAALGKPHEVLRFDAGHGSQRTDERIIQTEAQIDFEARHLGTTPPL
jgi:acetyl esterase/lipase